MKFRITVTAEYVEPLNAQRMVTALRRRFNCGTSLRPEIGEHLLDSHVEVEYVPPIPAAVTTYVVMDGAKPIKLCDTEVQAQHYVDHHEKPWHLSIEEVSN